VTALALDTSVAVPLLVRPHPAHAAVVRWADGREVVLAGHALAETYAVLTRLPDDLRVSPADAADLLGERFGAPLVLDRATSADLPAVLAAAGVGGGAVYDALVALAAVAHGARLATRDARARPTYEAVGADVEIVG
jgi:predicted nucleic acid-binding protein